VNRPSRPPHAPADPGGSARDRIVEAATRAFAEQGFDGARIEAIGRAAGVNKALLYYYFPGKQELYRGLVLECVTALGERLAAAEAPESSARETLARMVFAFIELSEERPFAAQFLVREVVNAWGHLRDEDFPVLLAQAGPIAGTVRRGIARGEFRPVPPLYVHLLFMGAMNLFLVSAAARARGSRIVGQPDLDPDPRAYARFVADVVVRGLSAEPPADAPPPSSPGVPA